MSNILIIKHGSLGDIAQISGALKDFRAFHANNKIFILTTFQYSEVLGRCPYIDAVLIDRRLPRWNIFYLVKLKKIDDVEEEIVIRSPVDNFTKGAPQELDWWKKEPLWEINFISRISQFN